MAILGLRVKEGECEEVFDRIMDVDSRFRNKLGGKGYSEFSRDQEVGKFLKSLREFENFYINLISLFLTRYSAGEKRKLWAIGGLVQLGRKWPSFRSDFEEFFKYIKGKKVSNDIKKITNDFEKDVKKLDDIFKNLWQIFEGRWTTKIDIFRRARKGAIGMLTTGILKATADIVNILNNPQKPGNRYNMFGIQEDSASNIAAFAKIYTYGAWLQKMGLGDAKSFAYDFGDGIHNLQKLFDVGELISRSLAKWGSFGAVNFRKGAFTIRRRRMRIGRREWREIDKKLNGFRIAIEKIVEGYKRSKSPVPLGLENRVEIYKKQLDELADMFHLFADALK